MVYFKSYNLQHYYLLIDITVHWFAATSYQELSKAAVFQQHKSLRMMVENECVHEEVTEKKAQVISL